MTCGDLNDYVSIFTADQCAAYQDDLREAAGICGCPPLSCSLCQLDNMALQDFSLLSLLNNYSCAALNGIIGGFSKEDCTASQALISENNEQCCSPTPTSTPVLPSDDDPIIGGVESSDSSNFFFRFVILLLSYVIIALGEVIILILDQINPSVLFLHLFRFYT